MTTFLFIGGPHDKKALSLKIAKSITVFSIEEGYKKYQYQRYQFHAENRAENMIEYWDIFLWGEAPSADSIFALLKSNNIMPHSTEMFS
jgi:hypothetical protein